MKNNLLLIMLFLTCQISNSQNYYYYYNGNKVFLELDTSVVNLITENNFTNSETNNVGFKNYSLQQDNNLVANKFGKVEYLSEQSSAVFHQKLNLLKSIPTIKSIGLYFKKSATSSIGTSNYFYVKLKNENDFSILQQYCIQKGVQIVKQVPNMNLWFILSATNAAFTSLELSNQFYESGLFSDIDPAFIFNFDTSCANDTNFGDLWGLNNIANPSIDINACQAWELSEGEGVTIAIVDQGIDLTHNDLNANIHPLSYNCQAGTSPSVFSNQGVHGTLVAGILGAIKDNNLQVVGAAPSSKIMAISHPLSTITLNISAELASGISWAYQNGADVINNSWGDQGGEFYNAMHSTILENSIINALTLGRNNKGTVVVFASGNRAINTPLMDYPSTFNDDIIAVGSINNLGQRSIFNSTRGSGYGSKLDIVAPGSNIMTTNPNNQTHSDSGTSFASPYVAGVCALILSVNPCLTGKQVRDIIEQTSQKVGGYSYINSPGRFNGSWNSEMGYGLIDAFAAVQLAKTLGSPTLDLFIKDSQNDTGFEPNTTTQFMWTSDDIWVRNNNNITFGALHQNPEYHSNSYPNFVKVRVKNKSCVSSIGNEKIKLYWAKAATALAWPNNWNGSMSLNNIPLGGEIGEVNIPSLGPGEETVVSFDWVVPNPADYSTINSEPWHFCLLARIIADQDLMTFSETWDVNANTKNNNNIAWKNITVVDVLPDNNYNPIRTIGGIIAVGNPFDEQRVFYLEMVKEDIETGKAIYDEAEVSFKMDEILYQAWERGGKESQLLDETLDDRKLVAKGNNVILDNISFEANERGSAYISFNFLTRELTDKSNYRYHVIQRDALSGDIIGGETFVIHKGSRVPFEADAGGDKQVSSNQPLTISAADINEPAIYNWYNMNGNLIFQGKNLEIPNAIAQKYKLEVISTVDGFKDYNEVEIKLKPSTIESITPNPSEYIIGVNYNLTNANSAYLMTLGTYGSNAVSNNYMIDINLNSITLDISNYADGFYTLVLIVNGEIVDAKTVIKQ